MNPQLPHEYSTRIVALLGALSVGDALRILHRAIGQVLDNASTSADLKMPTVPFPAHLLQRHRGGPSKIKDNPAVRDFIHALPSGLTIEQIAERCRSRFGAAVAPSKTAVHRYLQSIKETIGE